MTERPIIVIGGGVAGSVVAGTLARECSAPIVVLESGSSAGALNEPESRTLSFVEALARPSTRRDDLVVRRTARQEPKGYPAGSGIGGSGEINALVASWGMKLDTESWGDRLAVELQSGLRALPHELRTANEGEWGPMDRALVDSCVEMGVARNDALWNDTTSPEGVGTVTLFARGDRRSTGVDALLKQAIAAGRVRVDRDARVHRLLVRDDVVRGVELSSGVTLEARAVVVCAGAFESVEILQRTGVLPACVRGVQDHPAVAFVTRDPVAQSSVLSIGAIGRLSVGPGVGNVHLVSMNATAPGEHSHPALLVALMDVESRGSITLHEDGSVARELAMLSSERERRTLGAAVRRCVEIVARIENRLGTELHLSERTESVRWLASATDADVEDWLVTTSGVYAHAASSVPLGGEFLDLRGAVRNVDGLWVADASVMPTLISGNPTLTVAALARVIAREVAGVTAAS